MATERLQIVIDAVFKGKGGIEQAGRELKELDKEARKASEGTRYMADKVKGHLTGLTAGFVAAGVVVQQTYQIIGEGAELEKAAMQFDNLVASIGSTSDAMLGDLRAATSGMLSDAELMAGASQIISLGLADSQEGVVRLSTAVSTLGLDMQQVILTFANNSTARLDALGLSIEDVTSKAAELEAQGFVGDAFDEAVIIALEEKMLLLGDASATTAGEMAKFEATLANTFNEAKIMMAERWQGVFFGLNTAIGLTQHELTGAEQGMGRFAWAVLNPIENARALAGELGIVENKYSDVQKEAASYDRALMGMNFTQKETTEAIDKTAFAFEEYSDAADMYATQARENTTLTEHEAAKFAYLSEQAAILRDELMEATYGHEEFADAAMMYASQAETNSTLTEQQANHFRYLAEQSELAAEKILLLEEAEAGYFVEAINATDQTFNLNQEMFNAAEQAGASAEELAILGGGLGLYSEEAVDAALKTAAVRIKIQELAEEYAAGNITLGEYRTQVQLFINDLEGIPSERTISFKLDIPPIPSELSGQPTGVKQTDQGNVIYGASGLDFTVPPGFPNDSFGPIFVQSGEHVKVTPAGETSSNSRGGGNTINVYAYPGMSANAIASAVNQQLVVGG